MMKKRANSIYSNPSEKSSTSSIDAVRGKYMHGLFVAYTEGGDALAEGIGFQEVTEMGK